MKKELIPLSYTPVPHMALAEVLKAYAASNHQDLVADFEKRFSEIIGAKYAIALNSGTAAIHLGLKAIGVQPDDVVLVSTFTYVASVNPIRYLRAVPFFVDSSADDWNMDPHLLEQAIEKCLSEGKKPKAILVVHTYGMPAKMHEILQIAARHSIPILEDAAEALGSTYQGQNIGTLGAIGIFSFNNNKLFTTYGGGALVTNNSEMAAKVNLWAGQSRDNQPYYEHREVGFNYKMSPLNAAAGLAQIDTVTDKVFGRRKIFEKYRDRLNEGVGWQEEAPDVFSNRWITAIQLPMSVKVREVQDFLSAKGIETRPVWKPMHLQPVFKDFQCCSNGNAEQLFASGICLPSGENLENAQVEEITDHISRYVKNSD